MNGGFDLIWVVIVFFGGSFGLPMGMPPGPEDPIMTNVAPEDCLLYVTWTGVGKADADRSPTDNWMMQPQLGLLLPKIRKATSKFIRKQTEVNEDPLVEPVAELISTVIESSLSRPTAMFMNTPVLDQDGDNKKAQIVSVRGGMIVATTDRAKLVAEKFNNLVSKCRKTIGETGPVLLADINGQPAIELPNALDDVSVFIAKRDGYILIGFGDGSIEQMDQDIKTPGPTWLLERRKRLQVDHFASAGFINTKTAFEFLEIIDGRWWQFSLRQTKDLHEGIEDATWVTGLDQHGFISRMEFGTEENKHGIFSFIDKDPIPESFLDELPSDAMLGLATRFVERANGGLGSINSHSGHQSRLVGGVR